MASEHEKLVEEVARAIAKAAGDLRVRDWHYNTARSILALIAERTKEATIPMHHELRRENRKDPEADRAIRTAYEYAAGDLAWRSMHAASALWPSHGTDGKEEKAR